MIENVPELRTLVAIADHGSLSAVARAMGLSLNAISRRLAQLEASVGVRLAQRDTRKLVLTDEGRRLVEHARRIVLAIDEAEEALRPRASGHHGVVRVALHPDVMEQPLFASLRDLLAQHPGLSIEVSGQRSMIDPIASHFDLVVWVGEVRSRTLVVRKLDAIAWALCASPAYVNEHGAPKTPRELASHACIRARGDRPETHWSLRDERGNETTVPVGGRFSSDDPGALRVATYAGMGIGIRPGREVADQSERLVRILPRWHLTPLTVRLVAPPGRMRLGRVRAVADLVVSAMSAGELSR